MSSTVATDSHEHSGTVKTEVEKDCIHTMDMPDAVAALTPPTSEDNDVKRERRASSELSDADPGVLQEDDEEEIEPDHYYDGGKIPVFKPTMEQFRSFKKYVEKIDKYGMKAGIVKVIPPPEWRESLPQLDELVKTIKIKNPIKQEFMGTHGTYTQANIEKQRSYNLPEWKAVTEEPQNQPPARRGERRRNQDKVVRGGGNTRGRGAASTAKKEDTAAPAQKRKPGRPSRNQRSNAAASTGDSDKKDSDVVQSVEKPVPATKEKKPRGRQPKGDTKKSVSSRRMNNQTEKVDVVDEAAFDGFDFRLHDLEDYTPERCKELEVAYWKSLTFAQPMYAADMPGSLFTDDVTSWNVAKLENLLDVLGTKVPGVNTAYLYMGMWKATFAWHLEDVDLYSINYIHFGAPKQWYSISQEDARKFEAAMKNVWPTDSKNCDQFLRHKTYLISPQLLKEKYNIEVNRLVHHEGEFVITYPYGYHSGYNLGYNCAESVNFALESWLDFGRIARKCECEADSVWVDVAEIERKLRGEPTPEYYEETDDDDEDEIQRPDNLPTPPASVKGKPSKKRKRDAQDHGEQQTKKKKIRIRIKSATRELCALCPNDAPYEPLLDTDNGKKAHKSCALYTPETWLTIDENGKELVLGVSGIDKARLDLKCNFCRMKRGACFQCASKKCTRAFHATCAIAAGVQIDVGPVPTFGEDGTEYFEEGYDLRCKFHRARRQKNLDPDTLETSKLINNYAKKLRPQDQVQVQYLNGDVFGGIVVENRPGESAVLIDVLPDGDRVEVEWKWLAVLNPQDSQRPKPSAAAIPMPADMNKQSVSIGNRQDGVPEVDEIFLDTESNKWAEFYSLGLPPQGYRTGHINNKDQRRINFDKADRIYYYLGQVSTEARSKFTDDPAKQEPVSSADFLARARPYNPPAVPAEVKKYSSPYTSDAASKIYSYKPKKPVMPQGTFPADAYYSSTRLPAAFPGQYSNYTNHVRQNSSDTAARGPSSTARLYNIAPMPAQMPSLQPAPEMRMSSVPRPSSDSSTSSVSSAHKTPWTPPSQVYQSHGLDKDVTATGVSTTAAAGATAYGTPPPSRPAATYSTVQEFGRHLAEQTQLVTQQQQQPAKMWTGSGYVDAHTAWSKLAAHPDGHGVEGESPRQPTPSPLSVAGGRH